GIAVFQYFYKAKRTDNKRFLFAFLRFLSLFLLGVLLFNPTFKQTIITNIKPNLVVAIDNSESIRYLKQDAKVRGFLKEFKKSGLSDKFQIHYYSFGNTVNELSDSIQFTASQTNIATVFSSFKELYSDTNSPTLLLTDGNQTYGQDYVLSSLTYKQPIYPVVLGDSVLKSDLKIANIQHNKYAFLNNEFPVEITVNYLGNTAIKEELSVYSGNTKIYSKNIELSNENTTVVLSFYLKARNIGRYKYRAVITPITNEENITNNTRDFSVEVIDERTNVLLISDIIHPDIGAVKKAIETNKQRKVTIQTTSDVIDYNKYQLVVLYQPTVKFKKVFQQIDVFKKNHFTITGLQTDWVFLNSVSENYKNSVVNQSQDFSGNYNAGFDLFQNEELDFSSFPPLVGFYGNVTLNSSASVLLHQQIGSVLTEAPLFCFFENNNRREAVLFGEGIWKWRAQSFVNTQNFEKFDALIGKTIQYLASNNKRERLVLDIEDEFLLGQAKLKAQYFDKNYVTDENEIISCKLIHQETKEAIEFDFLYKNNGYELDLKHLKAGVYSYEVTIQKDRLTKKGMFEILDFNIESQFINPNVTKLGQLATNSKTQLYYISKYKQLFEELRNNEKYKITQRETTTQLPLVNWKYLLGILILVLGVEWFLRKYNGLI
ncbi:MAG: VWA domain-containing protein, partial [Flavobacteriaceae bacterium]|nr:VWA domain-containing protein [Flavobacteriaceae bacterium]